jgi:hypothetical protein
VANSVIDRIKSAWNAFRTISTYSYEDEPVPYGSVISYGDRPDRQRFTRGNERSIVTSIYNRIAMDVASITINHVRLDENGRFTSIIDSGLNRCLNLSANIDQTGRAMKQDLVSSLLDEGVIALVPTDTTENPKKTDSYDILEMRVGRITAWMPDRVRVDLYNEQTGTHQEITLLKKQVAIIENPMYSVMNDTNSTLRRLIRKLNTLDYIDKQITSGKFNMIVQLPYTVRTEKKEEEAAKRINRLSNQLDGNKYGVAYIDSAEKVTQLNRPLDNNIMSQVEYLTNELYGQLGLSQEVMNGKANEEQQLSYESHTVEPILSAIVDEIKRKFLTKTALSQGQSIMYFKDPFKLVPVSTFAEIADKLTRNEIMSSNELRQIIGLKPSDNPKADELVNSNISESNQQIQERQEKNQNQELEPNETKQSNDVDSIVKEV